MTNRTLRIIIRAGRITIAVGFVCDVIGLVFPALLRPLSLVGSVLLVAGASVAFIHPVIVRHREARDKAGEDSETGAEGREAEQPQDTSRY